MSQPDLYLMAAIGAAVLFFVLFLQGRGALRSAREEIRAAQADIERTGRDLETARKETAEARSRHDALNATHATLGQEAARLRTSLQHVVETRAELAEERDAVAAARDAVQQQLYALRSDHAALHADTDGKLASAQRELTAMKELREEMSQKFEQLATATLRRTGEDFSKAHTEKLTELLTPFREHVSRFENELRGVHKATDQERTRLSEQIRTLTERSDLIRTEAENLTRALKGEKQRQGAWGEMILERILEESGLERGTHYETQNSQRDEHGKMWRPDVVVKMPRGKCLVIDSKVSLIAYEAAVNAETDEDRARHLRDHVTAVRRHIDTLADKGYHRLDDGSVDYVLMFMPIEGALSEALRTQGDLTAYAVSRGIGVMTPTTLMVTLRTVDHIWTVERRESNAEDIARRAGLLHDKVVGFVTNMEKVGTALDTAARAHSDAMGQLSSGSGNLLGQVDKLKKMGAKTSKAIPVAFDPAEDDDDTGGTDDTGGVNDTGADQIAGDGTSRALPRPAHEPAE